jgi:hypothetical protein
MSTTRLAMRYGIGKGTLLRLIREKESLYETEASALFVRSGGVTTI